MRTVTLNKRIHKRYSGESAKKKPKQLWQSMKHAVAEILDKVKDRRRSGSFCLYKRVRQGRYQMQITIKVTEEEIKEAYEAVDPALIDVIRKALVNIRSYHEKQSQNSWFTS